MSPAFRRRSRAADHRPAAGLCPLADQRPASAVGARAGQSLLAAPLRPRASSPRRATSAASASGRRIRSCSTGWLTSFVADGWELKRLHRLLMTSTAYRQSSQRTAQLDAVDPDNRLLGRMSVRRLEAEALRDAMLAASGKLNLTDARPAGAGDGRRSRAGDRGHRQPRQRRPAGGQADVALAARSSAAASTCRSAARCRSSMLETFDAPALTPELRAAESLDRRAAVAAADEQRVRARAGRDAWPSE